MFVELVTIPESMWLMIGFVLIVDLYMRGVLRHYTKLNSQIDGCVIDIIT